MLVPLEIRKNADGTYVLSMTTGNTGRLICVLQSMVTNSLNNPGRVVVRYFAETGKPKLMVQVWDPLTEQQQQEDKQHGEDTATG